MTEIQQTNIAVANFIIDELHKDKRLCSQAGSNLNTAREQWYWRDS